MGLPWLIYALGGGWGHLNRAVALGRVIARHRSVHILTNSVYADWVEAWLQQRSSSEAVPTIHKFSPQATVNATRAWVQEALWHERYDCLIVDTFPRGIGGELVEILPQITSLRIWVHRDLNPDYIAAKAISEFVQQWYDGILIPGEVDAPLAHLPQVVQTPAWLICEADELPSKSAARSRLQIPNPADPTPVIVVGATGQPAELDMFGGLALRLTQIFPDAIIRCVAATCPPSCPPEIWVTHYPAIECWRAADVVISGAGYNTVYECAALGVPLVAFPLPRLYDRQVRRARRWTHPVRSLEEAAPLIQTLLHQVSRSHPLTYINGATIAVQSISQWNINKEGRAIHRSYQKQVSDFLS